jgi:hypothetical protein
MDVIWGKREAKYFCGYDWTGSISLIRFRKFDFARMAETVIANEAKQSIAPREEGMDCLVAAPVIGRLSRPPLLSIVSGYCPYLTTGVRV